MSLLHISVLLCFLFSSQTEQFQSTKLLLWQELASTMMKHQINFVSWPNLIFPEIQSPSSNAFLKLHFSIYSYFESTTLRKYVFWRQPPSEVRSRLKGNKKEIVNLHLICNSVAELKCFWGWLKKSVFEDGDAIFF